MPEPSPIFLDMNMARNSDGTDSTVGLAFRQSPDGALAPTDGINKYARFGTHDPSSRAAQNALKEVRALYDQKLASGRTPAYQPFGQDYIVPPLSDPSSPDRQAEVNELRDVQRIRAGKMLLDTPNFLDTMGLPRDEWGWLGEMKGPGVFFRAEQKYFEDGNFARDYGVVDGNGLKLPHGKEMVKRGDRFVMHDHPERNDLFDSPDSIPMLQESPMSVMTNQGPMPVQPAQQATSSYPPGADPMSDFAISRRTAQMQGAPMGADDGSLVNLNDFQVPQRQAMPQQQDPMMQYQPQNPYMTGGQMPYNGGMSGPYMQGRMQNILDEMLTRQQYGRQFNDMQMQRDQYDDGWDRFQADIFNPLMGALGGSRTTAAMAADSNNRRSMIQNRRSFRRQLQDDQWGQTKDLISMIAANDPQTIKNQNALAKLQMEMYQKQINAQNANTQQFGAYSNAAYKSRTAAVQEQNARTNESNMLRMLNEGADRSQQGWARINNQAGQWEQSLAMRQAELEQRQANAAQHNDQFAIQQAFREQQELNDEAFRYQKLKDDMEARAEGLNSDGSSKVSDEYRKKYGIPRKEEPNQNQQGFDLLKMLGFNQPPTTSVSSTAPQTRQASPLTTTRVNKTTGGSSGQRAATSGKPLTDDVFKSLIAKYGRDIEGAKAEARRLGYRVN